MCILFVTPTLPVPTSGGRTRVYNLIKHLAVRHQVTVLSFLQSADREWLPVLKPYCADLELVPFAGFKPLGKWHNRVRGWAQILFSHRSRYAHTFPVEAMRGTLRALLDRQHFDVVVFETLYLVELANEVVGIPILLGQQNVESDVQKRAYEVATHPLHRWRDKLLWRKLLKFEKSYLAHFPVCIAVSERDADLLRELSPSTSIHIVPNGVDSECFGPPAEIERPVDRLLFFGTLNYGPNVEGILWFVQEIFPHIRSAKPEISLEIVGLDPVPEVIALQKHSGVTVVGFVPDVRKKLWSTTVCVVPLLTGGGTRLKILEALAAGCPIVSTTIGAEGLDLQDGQHLLIADTPGAFAAQVLTLLDSPTMQQALAHRGQQAVARQYDWSSIAEKMEAVLTDTIKTWHGGRKS